MKIICSCGERVSDTGCPQDNKGKILKSHNEEAHDQALSCAVQQLIGAYCNSKVETWIKEWHPEALSWRVDWSDLKEIKSLVDDFMNSLSSKYCVSVYQCEACGRVLIQKEPQLFEYSVFNSESNDQNVLNGQKNV